MTSARRYISQARFRHGGRGRIELLRQAGGGARSRRGSGLQDGEPCRRARKNGKAINANRELAYPAQIAKSPRELSPAPAPPRAAGAVSRGNPPDPLPAGRRAPGGG